jgi:nicotinamide-nucleotide amidase
METEIITIGDEILIGQIVDTNSAWMAQKLNEEGIHVRQINSISDDPDHIESTLAETGKRVPLVLITGGLGPTRDDRTKQVICKFFDTRLIEDPEVLENVTRLLSNRGIGINRLNREQALVPENAIVLPNEMGTAPCLWLKKEKTTYIFMPGVPFEMKNLMEKEVLPAIRKEFKTIPILHRTIQVFGLAESVLAEKLEEWENSLPDFISLAYLPAPEGIRLRLSARGGSDNRQGTREKGDRRRETGEERCGEYLRDLFKLKIGELKKIIPKNIIGFESDTLSSVAGGLLKEKGLTVSTAESCTGGFIAHSITSVSGSSDYFKGSIVAYSNEIKSKILGIDPGIIVQNGAVSKEVVEAMAASSRKLFGTDYAVSTSGIAGPLGGTETKPVGMVWIAVAGPGKIVSKVYNFGNNRERNIIRASQTALNMLRQLLMING